MLRFVFRPWIHRRSTASMILSQRHVATLGLAVMGAGTSALFLRPTIRLDAPTSVLEIATVKDPATDIEFPTTLRIPSRFPLPEYTLLGVGVRKVRTLRFSTTRWLALKFPKVSFLNVKVYSVGFYADLAGVPPVCLTPLFLYVPWFISFDSRSVVTPVLMKKSDILWKTPLVLCVLVREYSWTFWQYSSMHFCFTSSSSFNIV